jgi:hypothetical protein
MSPLKGSAFFIKVEKGYDMLATYESPVGTVKRAPHVEFIDMSQAPAKAEQLAGALLSDDQDAAAKLERPSFLGFTLDALVGGGSGAPVDGRGGATFAFGLTGLLQYGVLDVGLGGTNTGFFDQWSTIYDSA